MPRRREAWGKRIAVIAGLAVVLIMFLRWFEHRNVFHPTRTLEGHPSELKRPFEDVRFQTSDGLSLHGWYFPVATNTNGTGVAVLFCHGNGGNISHRLAFYQAILETGASVFTYDYRGYGQSDGRPSEEGTYKDADAALDWLVDRGYSRTNIIAFGESLGGGVASEVALRRSLGGLVLQSTFTSIPDVGAEIFWWLPVRSLGSIEYNTVERLPRIQAPVVVMHSREDALIRYSHAERNFEAANEPKWLIELQGDHNDSLTDREAFKSGVQRLVDHLHARVE